jgi:PAS domain S-box-containing protein
MGDPPAATTTIPHARSWSSQPPNLRAAALGAAVALAYVIAARTGFRLAFVAEQVTTVWAPTGIALAALAAGGTRLWPAVWLGAFLANAGSAAPAWTAFVIASGNTLEAVAAITLLRRLPRVELAFRRVADVVAFILVAAASCTAISATIGAATLCAAGVQPWTRFGALWFDWWLGDALGALIVAPAILTTIQRSWTRPDAVRAAAWVAGSAVVTHLIFGQLLGLTGHPFEYVVFPLVIAAAVRGGPHVTALVVLGASAITIWNTAGGSGPFAGPEVHRSLILLQVFMGVLATTALLLAAAMAERRTSEQRQRDAAAVLRRREEMLTLAQRAGGVATFEWDFRNQIAQCSAEFFRIFRLPARDGVMTVADWGGFVHPDDRERMAAHLSRAIEGQEPAAADYRIVAADGTTRWLSYAGQLERTAEGDRMVGTVVDISDRKRLEEELRRRAADVERALDDVVETEAALRESRDVLALAMRGGAMGAWSRNLATNEVWWSRELEEIVGLEPGAFSRTEAGFFEFVHDEDRPAVRQAVDDAVAHGSDYVVEFRFRHASGEWRWMEGRGRAVYGEAGAPRMLYGIGIDVTARKRAEMALRDAKSAAESANQLKDQFLATLSHELRTPLNAILGYTRMLQTNAIAPEKRERAIEVIERNAAAQHQLVEDLLDMSRITTGKLRLEPEPVPVAAVLREAVEGVKPAAGAKGITLSVDLDPFAGTVLADTTRLQQVFWNLLTNAVKFTDPGGRVSASLRRDGGTVEVSVSDTGIGISAEFLPFVFEPFRQGDARFDRAHGGLGLGLAIARQLVELHGGTIDAASGGAGQGATFTVRLPLRTA